MGTRNLRKYVCEDCGHSQMMRPYEFTKAFRPHCQECGSTLLTLSKSSKRRDEEAKIRKAAESGRLCPSRYNSH